MSDLTPEQQKVLRELKAAPSYRKASPKTRLALIEAALVESNLSTPNQAHSDRDSEGALQQRPSQGWGPTSESNTQDAEQFLRRAIPLASKYGTAGQLAQAVQRSAYPGRYDQRRSLAQKLMGGGDSGGGGGDIAGSIPVAGGAAHGGSIQQTVGDPDARKRVILANYLTRNDPGSLLLRLGVVSPNEATTQQMSATLPPQQASAQGRGSKDNLVGRVAKGFKAGVPVLHETSVGGQHETAGLPGYPARDFFAPAGSAAVAPISGTVIKLSGHDPKNGPTNGPHGPLGWSVYIKGKDGKVYFLTHMGSRNVKVGQKVRTGQKIGTVANYDKYGTPSHIHEGVHG